MNFNLDTQTYERAIVMGVTKFKGNIDGNDIDTCTVMIATKLNDETGNAIGLGLAKTKFGTADNFHRFSGLTFPCEVEIAFSKVTNGSGKSSMIMKDFKLLNPPAKKD